MRTTIISFFLFLAAGPAPAQLPVIAELPCEGEWMPQAPICGDWQNIDTLQSGKPFTGKHEWIEDDLRPIASEPSPYAYRTPCSSPTAERYSQRRVCRITGVVQERTVRIEYHFVTTEYKNVVERLSKNSN